jgi:hypothetical protein
MNLKNMMVFERIQIPKADSIHVRCAEKANIHREKLERN